MESCCESDRSRKKGVWSGIIYGLVPHTFCIAFVVMSLIGAIGGAALAKRFLLIPHFFLFLTILSLASATLAALFYLKKNSCCNPKGIRKKYRYLLTLYSVTIITNVLVAYLIFPALASGPALSNSETESRQLSSARLEVQIPCPGHAPLIISELEKVSGVERISFQTPRTFEIAYDPQETSLEKIEAAEIFKTFKLRN